MATPQPPTNMVTMTNTPKTPTEPARLPTETTRVLLPAETAGTPSSPTARLNFNRYVSTLSTQGRITRLKTFTQHGRVSTYEHVVCVAHTALTWSRALHLSVNEKELVRGAMLHDYYLYDWHTTTNNKHAINHPVIAATNAAQDFDLSAKERNIIEAHMWPLPPTRIPTSKEAWLVCAADKWRSLGETLFKRT